MSAQALTQRNRVGLVLAGTISAASFGWSAAMPAAGGEGVPIGVLVWAGVFNVAAIAVAIWAWRRSCRPACRIVAALVGLPALSAVPGLLLEGLPAVVVVSAAMNIVVSVMPSPCL